MRIAFFEIKDWEKEYLEKTLQGNDLFFSDEKLTSENADKFSGYDCVSVFIYSKIDKEALVKLSNLKCITTRSTGFDHIDLEECKKKGINVSNVPFYGDNTVAEHTFGLILSLSRKIPESVQKTKEGNFSNKGLMGFDLKGKTLGIIGTGNIGMRTIMIAQGFNMNVIAFDICRNEEKAKELGFEYVEMEELLETSDIVTLHAPLNEQTKHLMNSENLNKMKKGSYIINTSRGGLVDTEALVVALKEKRIAGAGLDVLEEEKQFSDNPSYSITELLKMPNVIVTPHNAFNSEEAIKRILDTTNENIKAFNEGNSTNIVTGH